MALADVLSSLVSNPDVALKFFVTAGVLLIVGLYSRADSLYPNFPVADADEKSISKRKENFATRSKQVVYQALKQFGRPFQVSTAVGVKIILPNSYVNEIRNHPDLHFQDSIKQDFLGHLRGLESFNMDPVTEKIFTDAIRIKLTQSLGQITDDLCEEITAALDARLGNSNEWQEITAKPAMLYLVARASSRVFLGPALAQNEEWIQLFIDFTQSAFQAVQVLRTWPSVLRPVANEFLPECRALRALVARARALLEPEIAARRRRNAGLVAQGKPLPKTADSLTWMDEMAKGRPYDATVLQLALSAAAIHTTTDLTLNALWDLAAHQAFVEPLREEVRTVLREDGWKKTSLYKMKLLDSCLKEVQRMSPVTIVQMQRKAKKEVTLQDGTVIPKGACTAVTMDPMMDPKVFPEPEKFDAYRFLKLRQQPQQENNWQLVTTSPQHLGFGHGVHACPGRFFASNEVKTVLCYMLLMYDWKLPEGQGRPKTITHNYENVADPTAKIVFRRRNENMSV